MTERNRKINTVEQPGNAWSDIALDTVLEQLWYTWSDVGLSMIGGGFRIRAASEGLHDIRSVRVQNLDQYQRYSLPRGADAGILLSMAPLCLSLVTIEGEKTRVLVHKAYTGKDLVGRYGAFFIHLLAGLPQNFSVVHAISLWESPFWKTSDASLDRRSTTLERVPLTSLYQAQNDIPFTPKRIKHLQNSLPYVIEAYLTKKPIIEPKTRQKAQTETPQKIYIAAPDSDIAQLISGLAHSLPPQLLRDLTFSTYEHDVSEATTEIIGTCWISDPKAENDPHVKDLLPTHYYQEMLAINCYTGMHSSLQDNPLVENKVLARLFAQDAMKYFTKSGTQEPTMRFRMLLELSRRTVNLDTGTFASRVDHFLNLYDRIVIIGEKPIKPLFASSDYPYIAEMLSDPFYQEMLMMIAIDEPDWWWGAGKNSGRATVINLRQISVKIPLLAQVLSAIAHCAIPTVVAGVQKEASQVTQIAGGDASLKISLDVMCCAAPPTVDSGVWITLLQALQDIKPVVMFQQRCWDIYADLMKIWVSLLPPSAENNKLVQPFLVVSWSQFGDFLMLHLPFDWTVQATKELVSQSPSTLTKESVQQLEAYYPQIIEFLQLLVQDMQRWPVALGLFYNLAAGTYTKRWELFRILQDSALGQHEESALKLLAIASQFPIDEQVLYLKHVGPQYLALKTKMAPAVLEMFGKLAQQGAHKEKMEVLQRWFTSTRLSAWFDTPPHGEKNLAQVLQAALLSANAHESGDFLQNSGQKYIALYPRSSILLELFDIYARSGARQRIPLLAFWLRQHLDQDSVEFLLNAARLMADERREISEIYNLVQRYPKSRVLISCVKEFTEYLHTVNASVFESRSPTQEPSALERSLRFVYEASRQQRSEQFLYDWFVVARFVRKPTTFEDDGITITNSIGRLLSIRSVSPETCADLSKRLARAYIEDQRGLVGAIEIIRQAFAPPDLLYLLADIADGVREGIQQKYYPRSLFIACIFFAVESQVIFGDKNEQDEFVQRFLNTLLFGVDERAVQWLNAEAKKWTPSVRSQWQHFIAQWHNSKGASSLPERVQLWWEQRVAFAQMHLVLRSPRFKRVLRVAMDYMTTLNSYENKIPPEWWVKVEAINALEERAQQQGGRSKVAPAVGWLKRKVAFMQMRRALWIGHIGRIVRVATKHIDLLTSNKGPLPGKWWRQIDAACDFFLACEEADEQTTVAKEQAIIVAGERIENLACSGYPIRLTLHERRRKEAAERYCASQTQMTLRQWIPRTLQSQSVGFVASLASPPNGTASTQARRGPFGWFRK